MHQTEHDQLGWATFAPDEFAEQRPGRSARRILPAITEISGLLLSQQDQPTLFSSIAQVCARALDYPCVAILLFDAAVQHLEVAGISNAAINLLSTRRGKDGICKSLFPLETMRDLPWIKAVREGKIYVTNRPHEIFTPFAPRARARTTVRRLGISRGILLPLVANGKIVGALIACSATTEYAPGECTNLLALAQHIAYAAEIWRVYDRAEGRATVLKRLHTLSQTITSILDLDTLYQEIAKAAGRLARIDFCTVNALTPDLQGYTNYSAWGEGARSEVVLGVRSVDIFSSEMLNHAFAGEPILISDLDKFPTIRERLSHRHAGAVAIFPFRSLGKPVGFITVGRDNSGEWEGDTVEILNELAEYATVAYNNARRYSEATHQAAVQKALAESARMIARADTRSVIQAIVEAGSRLFMDSRFALLLPDASGDLICVAAHGPDTEEVLGFWVHNGEGLVGKVYESGRPALTSDIQAEEGSARKDIDERANFHSYMAVPLLAETGAIGVLVAGHHDLNLYTYSDLLVLNTLADHATIALQNERLLTEARRAAAEQETLAESARMIARAETDAILQTIVHAGSTLVLGSQFAVLLPDSDNNLEVVAAFGPETDRILSYKIKNDTGLMGRVFTLGQPLVVEDIQVAAGSTYQQAPERADFRSWMAVPMMSDQGAIGILAASHSQPGLYTEAHLKLLGTLADHATIALENQRLLTEARRAAAQQKALAESARMIARAETDTVLQTIVQVGSALIMDSQFGVLLPNGDELLCVAAYGSYTDTVLGNGIKMGEGLIGKVYDSHQPIMVTDVQQESGSTRPDIDAAAHFHSWMAVPMMTERGCIGVLVASHAELGLYNSSHLELLNTLADHATLALEKGRLLQEAKRQAVEQAALAEGANAIARLDVQAVLNTIVARASEIVKLSRCSVFLHDVRTDTLRWAAGEKSPPVLQAEIFPARQGLMGQAFTTGEPVRVDDITFDPRTTSRHLLDPTGTRSFLCVPLRWGTNTIGVLLTTHLDVGVFTLHDQELLSTFADYAAIALSNARLYGSLQQREEERAFLLHQLMTAQEAERRRVAVDIHDGPLQSIGVNMLAIDRIRRLLELDRAPDAAQELLQVRTGMSAVVQELRDVINGLRPVVLENLGLLAASNAYISHFREQTGIKVHLEDNLDGQRLPATKEVVFFRLLQEALTNVRKHSDALAAWVTFALADGVFKMNITDNGHGFDYKLVASSLESGHIGLHSMQERIEAIGGGMEVDSTVGQGTRLTFWIPN